MRGEYAFENMSLLLGVNSERIFTYSKKSGLLALFWGFFLKQISKKKKCVQ